MPLSAENVVALADAVVEFLGVSDDDEVKRRAVAQVPIMLSLIKAYTRGNGFSPDGIPNEDLQGVAVTALCRTVTNPAMSASQSESSPLVKVYPAGGLPDPATGGAVQAGAEVMAESSFAFSGGFSGFNDLEKVVLHAYRVRAG